MPPIAPFPPMPFQQPQGQSQPMQQGQPAPNDPDIEKMRKLLAEHLMQQIQQNPQAPQAPPPGRLNGWEAAAGAFNPNMVPFLQNRANAPGNALYEQQKMAFEAAMNQQQQAVPAATQLLGHQATVDANAAYRQDSLSSDAAQQAETARHNKAMEDAANARISKPPAPGYQLVYDLQGNAYWAPKPTGGAPSPTAQPIPLPGGQQAVNPTAADKYKSGVAGLDALQNTVDDMRAMYVRAAGNFTPGETLGTGTVTPGVHGTTERNIQEVASHIPIVGNIAGKFDPMAQQHEKLRNILALQLNKPVSGQQRLLQAEIDQLMGYIPSYGTDPSVAIPQFENMQRMINRLREKYTSAPGGSATPGGQFSGKSMTRDQFNQLKPEEQTRWTGGGGSVQ